MTCATEENGLPGYWKGGVSRRHSPHDSTTNPLPSRLLVPLFPTNNPPRRSCQAPTCLRYRVVLGDALIPARPFGVHCAEIAVPSLRSPSFFHGETQAAGVFKQTGGRRVPTVGTHVCIGIPLSAFWIYECKIVDKIDTAHKPLLPFGISSIPLK